MSKFLPEITGLDFIWFTCLFQCTWIKVVDSSRIGLHIFEIQSHISQNLRTTKLIVITTFTSLTGFYKTNAQSISFGYSDYSSLDYLNTGIHFYETGIYWRNDKMFVPGITVSFTDKYTKTELLPRYLKSNGTYYPDTFYQVSRYTERNIQKYSFKPLIRTNFNNRLVFVIAPEIGGGRQYQKQELSSGDTFHITKITNSGLLVYGLGMGLEYSILKNQNITFGTYPQFICFRSSTTSSRTEWFGVITFMLRFNFHPKFTKPQ